MAFPTTGILDDFNRANENPIAGNWTSPYYEASAFKVLSNQAICSAAGGVGMLWNTDYGPDCEAYITIVTKGANGNNGSMYIRWVDATGNGYRIRWDYEVGTDTIVLLRVDADAGTVLATYNQEITNGDSVGISAIGSTITAWYKSGAGAWTSLGSVTDTTYNNSGSIFIREDTDTAVYDDFGGGTVVTSPWLSVTSFQEA